MLFRAGLSGLRFRQPTLAEFNYSLGYIERSLVIDPGTGSELVVGDANVNRSTESVTENYFDMLVTHLAGSDAMLDSLYFTASNGVVNGTQITRLADGASNIIAHTAHLRRRLDVSFARVGGQTVDTLISYLSGSLAKHVSDSMAARLAGKTAANKPIFTTQNHITPTYTRNVNCWLNGVDLTAISPWNSAGSNFAAGVAISPRHVAIATHFVYGAGTAVRFVTNDNQVVTRTVTATQSLVDTIPFARDLTICLLDSDLPASITPCKVMPANFANYLPNIEKFGLTVFGTDYEEHAVTKDLRNIEYLANENQWVLACINCTESPASLLTETIIGGDSGNPVFMIVNGEIVLLTLWSTGGGGQGTSHHKFIPETNAAMASLGGGYQLETVSLSPFTDFGA